MKLYIVRHAQTHANVNKLIEGHTDGVLTEVGVKQAQHTARELTDIHFDAAYSSDLGRTLQTAHPILENRELQLIPESRVRGRDYGVYEGQPYDSIDWETEGTDFEHEDNYTKRVISFLEELNEQHPGETILLVTHGGVLRRILYHYCGMPKEKSVEHDVKNASVTIVDFDQEHPTCSYI